MGKRYRCGPIEVEAVKFDPVGEHRLKLPEGVVGIPSGGADNWAYMGCEFYIRSGGNLLRIEEGCWIVNELPGPVHTLAFRGEPRALSEEQFVRYTLVEEAEHG